MSVEPTPQSSGTYCLYRGYRDSEPFRDFCARTAGTPKFSNQLGSEFCVGVISSERPTVSNHVVGVLLRGSQRQVVDVYAGRNAAKVPDEQPVRNGSVVVNPDCDVQVTELASARVSVLGRCPLPEEAPVRAGKGVVGEALVDAEVPMRLRRERGQWALLEPLLVMPIAEPVGLVREFASVEGAGNVGHSRRLPSRGVRSGRQGRSNGSGVRSILQAVTQLSERLVETMDGFVRDELGAD